MMSKLLPLGWLHQRGNLEAPAHRFIRTASASARLVILGVPFGHISALVDNQRSFGQGASYSDEVILICSQYVRLVNHKVAAAGNDPAIFRL